MSKSTIGLVLLLICSNAYWVIGAIDQGISNTYREASFDSLQRSFDALLKISNLILRGKTSSEIRTLAKDQVSDSEVFDKLEGGDEGEALLVVGGLVFHLDADKRVKKVLAD
ncbi:hypothetical protein [Methylicorpusculum sp.]|uniref:hypothetical protein n=1 Tax=Methylicorpusculum sp. TaxID=2713644 RepID=UPI002717C0A2|nr:hypothetical protein [Methylicorpusculum sp.]MDO8846217.1 hypothetical protein [Methylicorpusculum sp.]